MLCMREKRIMADRHDTMHGNKSVKEHVIFWLVIGDSLSVYSLVCQIDLLGNQPLGSLSETLSLDADVFLTSLQQTSFENVLG